MTEILHAAAFLLGFIAVGALLRILFPPRHYARVCYRCDACGALHGSPFVRVAGGAIVPVPRPPDGWVSIGDERHACSAACAEILRLPPA